MKVFDRLEIKKLILRIAEKEDSKIPYLPYHYIEVIEPDRYMDDRLIMDLDNPNVPFADNDFFEYIEESPDYLAYEPFRKKIREWRATLNEPIKTKQEKIEAKKNLSRISKALLKPYDERGRPSKWDSSIFMLFEAFNTRRDEIGLFLDDIKGLELTIPKKKNRFREKLPHLARYDCALEYQSPGEIAKEIIVQEYGISKRHLNSILKSTKIMLSNTRSRRPQKVVKK